MKDGAGDDEFFFSGRQHGLCDSAFGLHGRLIPNYKKPAADPRDLGVQL